MKIEDQCDSSVGAGGPTNSFPPPFLFLSLSPSLSLSLPSSLLPSSLHMIEHLICHNY